MIGKIKSLTTDKYLKPVHAQIKELIEKNTQVLEVGCGSGALLLSLADKINKGIGLDVSESMIDYANASKQTKQITNVEFKAVDVTHPDFHPEACDVLIASLLFHVLPTKAALTLLEKSINIADDIIICAFSRPITKLQQLLLWADQRFNNHFPHFKQYQKMGYMEGLLSKLTGIRYEVYPNFDPVISIYRVRPVKG